MSDLPRINDITNICGNLLQASPRLWHMCRKLVGQPRFLPSLHTIQLTSFSELLEKVRQLYDLWNWNCFVLKNVGHLYILLLTNFKQFILILFQFCEIMKEIPSLRRVLQQTFWSLFFKSSKIIGSIMDDRKLNQIGKQYSKCVGRE